MNPIRRILSPFRFDSEWQARALDSLSLLACASGAGEVVDPPVVRPVRELEPSGQQMESEISTGGALSFGE